MSYEIRLGHGDLGLDIKARRPALLIALADRLPRLDEFGDADGRFRINVDGREFSGWRLVTSDRIEIRLDGRSFVFERREGVARADAAAGSGDEIRAEMPGTLVSHHVEVGAEVALGARLVTIESMKLQVTIAAPRAGVVARLHVDAGATFDRGAVLVSLAPAVAQEG
jgi:3-methylcrotonyl-CoA carboxylase alpha subunit